LTDLEDSWDSVPTGEPPTAEILRQGRRQSSRRRSVRRHLLSVAAAAALTGVFLAGNAMSGPPKAPGSHPAPQRALPSPVAFEADLSPAPSCDALLAMYVDRGLGRVSAWGWDSGYYPQWGYDRVEGPNGVVPLSDFSPAHADVPQAMPGQFPDARDLRTHRVTASETGTNVQETFVDEPDTVKTDGHLLVTLRDDELLTYDVSGPAVRRLSSLRLNGIDDDQLLLSGGTVVVIGADRQSPRSELTGLRRGTRVQTVSLTDPTHPAVTGNVAYAAAMSSTYQQGEAVRLVLSAGLPDLPFVHPSSHLSEKAALVRNREIVEHSKLEDWLPGYDAGDGREALLECGDVAVPPARVGLDTVAVVTFPVGSPTTPRAFGLAGATTIAYESADHLYLASTPAYGWSCVGCFGRSWDGGRGTSYLFQFDLEPDRAVHVASGEVEGTIRDRWSLDEAGGQLRVLVGPSSETGNFNSIVTFRRDGQRLAEAGRLDQLGRGEEIKSVRWQDDLALVVTYRQTDPLYVVDLRDRPRLVSELRVPGFSTYLHPLGPRRLIGIGAGPIGRGWGAQLGLFRVHDLTRVKRLDVWQYGPRTEARASWDPRAFTWLPEHRTVFTVIQHGRTGWLSIQHIAQSRLHNEMIRVEYGDDIAQVRTIGMPDGRVVLVTGEDVRFLAL